MSAGLRLEIVSIPHHSIVPLPDCILAGHRTLHALDDVRGRATVVLELLRAIVHCDAGALALVFIEPTFVRVLEPPPPTHVVNRDESRSPIRLKTRSANSSSTGRSPTAPISTFGIAKRKRLSRKSDGSTSPRHSRHRFAFAPTTFTTTRWPKSHVTFASAWKSGTQSSRASPRECGRLFTGK